MSNQLVYIGYYELSESKYVQLFDLSGKLLPAFLKERCFEYCYPKDQALSCAAWMLLASMLRRYACHLGDPLSLVGFNAGGKPVWSGGWQFNLSHSGDLAVCALCHQAELGVDVEVHRSLDAEEQAGLYADQALGEFEVAGRADSFFDLWTRKEAFLKACGLGLCDAAFKANQSGDEIRLLYQNQNWYCRSVKGFRSNYSLSICTGENNCTVETKEFYELD